MNTATSRIQLVAVVSHLATEKRTDIDRLKKSYSDIARPDFLWHYLLQSFATMGRSAGGANGLSARAGRGRGAAGASSQADRAALEPRSASSQ